MPLHITLASEASLVEGQTLNRANQENHFPLLSECVSSNQTFTFITL
jgi:hypothetical protein